MFERKKVKLQSKMPRKAIDDVICPRCGSSRIIKKGSRERKADSTSRFQCKVCEYKFTPNLIRRTFVGEPLHQTGKTIIPLDETRYAFKPGKRVVHHPGGKDTEYWEYRRNRSDINPKKGL